MEKRFSPRRSFTAYRILSPGRDRPWGRTPSSTRARFRTRPDAGHSRVRSRSMKTALVATGREPKRSSGEVLIPPVPPEMGRELGEGTAGGEGDPFSRLIRIRGGASDFLRSERYSAGLSAISQAA